MSLEKVDVIATAARKKRAEYQKWLATLPEEQKQAITQKKQEKRAAKARAATEALAQGRDGNFDSDSEYEIEA